MDPPFDAAVILVELARATADHQKVVALRPTAAQLAKSFEQFGALLADFGEASRKVAAAARGLDPDSGSSWLPLAGSLAAADIELAEPYLLDFCKHPRSSSHWLETNPTRNPVDWGLGYVVRCFKTVAECTSAIGVLTDTGRHLRAPLTLMRAVIEAAATACFLLDTEVTASERLRRVLNLHLAQTKEALLESAGLDHSSERAVELNEIMEFAASCGFTLRRYKPSGWSPPVIAGTGNEPSDSTRAIIDGVLPGLGASIWRNLSAVAHSRRAHTLLYDEYALVHNLQEWQRTEVVARHGVAALIVLRELCNRIDAYLGWDFGAWEETIDVVIEQCFVAAGMADDKIREHLGLKSQRS